MATASKTPPGAESAPEPPIDIGSLIYRRADLHGGRPCIAGTGISVQNIAIYERQGVFPEDIARRKSLTLAEVHAALAYYYANKAEIEATIEEDRAEFARAEEEWRRSHPESRA